MPLSKYHQKRNFQITPEPEGKQAGESAHPLRFVVQKHDATRLHFDFRLELDGVLKSWAVPKGPSLNPKDKHLAMMVEDHPLDYRNFEGVIPEGNYGAGTVMVWDRGTFHALETSDPVESAQILRKQLKQGNVKVHLLGKKLKGEFALVRIRAFKGNSWLLIKHNDEFAHHKIEHEDLSVLSGKSLKEIAQTNVSDAK